MRILALEDTLAHQVRMEKTLAEIAEEMGLDIQVKITGKIQEFKDYVENEDVNQIYFLDIDIKGEETKGLEVARFIRHHNPYAIIVNDVRVPFNDILYIETSSSSHKLRMVGKNFIKEFYGTIASVQEQDEKTQRFFASHKSFLVNIDNICDYDKKTKEIIFYEGRRCPVSRLRTKHLKEILKNK